MSPVNYLELLRLAAPEAILALAAFVVLFVDLGIMRDEPLRFRRAIAVGVTGVGCFAAFLALCGSPAHADPAGGLFVVDPLTQAVKVLLLVMAAFTAALGLQGDFTEHVGEFFSLLLLGTVGMMFLVSAEDLLTVFLALELTSLTLYVLTAFHKRSARSAEAGLKYFLFGGMAAAMLLYGLSLLYGLTGATNLRAVATGLRGVGLDPLLAVALVLVSVGFGFKIAAVPFHLWAPDAYEGAPTPAAAFIASGSKVASFFILGKVMMLGFAGHEGSGSWGAFVPGWLPLLATVAAASMIFGNLAALAQRSLRRLLAYSAIAHAGYLLLGVLALGFTAQREHGMASLLYYLATYGLTTIGAFGVVAVVEARGGGDLVDCAGLSRRAPLPALALMVFILSLAGIPPLAGFFGKFYLFVAAAGADGRGLGLLWLVILAIAMSAVSLYYYLQVLKQAYVAEPAPGAVAAAAMGPVPLAQTLTLVLLALAVIVLGCFPSLLLEPLGAAIKAAGM